MRDLRQLVRKLALEDGRYSADAFEFLFESLEPSVRLAGRADSQGTERHITGQELLNGLREQARKLFGPLAAHVWRTWGVRRTLDWGQIVFLLVGEGLLNRRESDSIEDFREGFDFDEFFVERYEFELPAEIGPMATGH
jgi:uncharacterized repeat protein (TIGR04138 family)